MAEKKEKSKTAFLIIDMINDFVHPDGALVAAGAKEIIPNIIRRREEAKKQGIPIIYLSDTHDPRDSEFRSWPEHGVKGSWGAQVVDELAPEEGNYALPKRRYSAFFSTELDLLLRELKIERVILTGTLTNICIFCTAIDAYMRGYQIVVPRDSVVALTPEEHEFALKQMEKLLSAEVV